MSTRKLALLVALGAIFLALGVTVGVNLGRGHSTPSPDPATSPTSATTETYNPDATDADDENADGGPPETQEEAWAPVVENFAVNFTHTSGGEKTWQQRLIGDPAQPYVTTEVAEQLATVDVRNIPKGHYESHEIVESGPFNLAVGVYYDQGWAMLLWLNTDGKDWQIYAYDKWEQ